MSADAERSSLRPGGRLRLLRDTAVFQAKLFVDGFRDIVMSPISIALALLDFLTNGDRFYRLLVLGRRTDRWINLFGAHERAGLDDAVDRIERVLTEQYQRGDLPASARDTITATLEKMRRSTSRTGAQRDGAPEAAANDDGPEPG